MFRVMKFDDAVRMYLSNGQSGKRLKYYSTGELAIYGMLKNDFPEDAVVERLSDGISTEVKGWYVPNECFLKIDEEIDEEIDEDNKRKDFVSRSLNVLEEAGKLLSGIDCRGVCCSECPLNIGHEYGFGCITNILVRMYEKERWNENEYYNHADKAQ